MNVDVEKIAGLLSEADDMITKQAKEIESLKSDLSKEIENNKSNINDEVSDYGIDIDDIEKKASFDEHVGFDSLGSASDTPDADTLSAEDKLNAFLGA